MDIDEFARQAAADFAKSQTGREDQYQLELPASVVEEFIKAAFYASLIPDENRWPRATLMCYRKGTEIDFHFLFDSRLPVSAAEIAKLSHAVGEGSHIGCIADRGALTIRGIHITRLSDRRDLGYSSFRTANSLKVRILGPGHLEMSSGGTALVYRAGEMTEEALLQDSRVMKALASVVSSTLQFYTSGAIEEIEDICNDLAKAIVLHGHGGMLLFANPNKRSYFSSLRVVDSPLLQDLLVQYWEHKRVLTTNSGGAANVMAQTPQVDFAASLKVAQDTEQLEKCVQAIADLAGADGAIALNYDCKVVAFNAIIGKLRVDPSMFRFVDGSGAPVSYDELVRHRGSRHQSALTFVMHVPGAFAFVISQDGFITAFHHREKRAVLCERGMRVLE